MRTRNAVFIIAMLFLMSDALALTKADTGQWNPRSGHCMVAFDDALAVTGGLNAFGKTLFFNDTWISRDGFSWVRLPLEAPHPPQRHLHAVLVYQERIWMLGGQGAAYLNDVWRSSDGAQWETVVAEAAWSPRRGMACLVHDGRMFLLGGEGFGDVCYNDVWVSENGNAWESLSNGARWAPRWEHAAVSFEDALYVLGGKDDYDIYKDVWRSEDGISWEKAGDLPAAVRGHCAEVFKGKIRVFGGVDAAGDRLHQTWTSSDGKVWETVETEAAWLPRARHASAVYNNRLWLAGGSVADGDANDVWYSRDGETWMPARAGGLLGALGCGCDCSAGDAKSRRLFLGDALLTGISLLVLCCLR